MCAKMVTAEGLYSHTWQVRCEAAGSAAHALPPGRWARCCLHRPPGAASAPYPDLPCRAAGGIWMLTSTSNHPGHLAL